MNRIQLATVAVLGALAAQCGGGEESAAITYYRDVKPIIDAYCTRCHVEGEVAPFPMTSYDLVYPFRARVRDSVANRTMPPFLAADGCADYSHDDSLPPEQIEKIVAWVDLGAPEGKPEDEPAPLTLDLGGLSRVDLSLAMPDSYEPTIQPDDYRCFVIPWPETETRFVTGFRGTPGVAPIVHHLIAYLGAPDAAGLYAALDAAEAGPGYTCFGGSGGPASILGAWAPGIDGSDYPEGTGLRVEPGSTVVLQVHYNLLQGEPVPDLTTLDFSLADSVLKEAFFLFWSNPEWSDSEAMPIPADDPDVVHSFSADPVAIIGGGFPLALSVYTAGLHMHLLGTRGGLAIRRMDGSSECMLDVPNWDFHWQRFFDFAEPKTLFLGDEVYLECHWDNTAGNQPMVDGVPRPVGERNWGEGSTDEMCLGALYVTLL